MRIILDTNILISFLISKNWIWIDSLFLQEDIQLLFSKHSIEEFLRVAHRQKFAKYFHHNTIEKLLRQISINGITIQTSSKIDLCRDPKDNFLLELAVDGKADYLISGDQDLLILNQIADCKIISISQWQQLLK